MTDGGTGAAAGRQNAIPTNMISYRGRKIPARIDTAARVGYIVEIMSNSFATSEHHSTLCLRDESDALVTPATLAAKVQAREGLQLVPSPATEALLVVTCLERSPASRGSADSPAEPGVLPLKFALFNLQKYIREDEFAVEFMLRGGTRHLLSRLTTDSPSGNSLAYALQAVRGLLEFESAWSDMDQPFIDRVLGLIASSAQPNVLKPATAIVRKLVISSPQLDNMGKQPSRENGAESPDLNNPFGFQTVWGRIVSMPDIDNVSVPAGYGFFRIVTKRLEGTGDLELVAQSLGLINACLRSAQQENSLYYQDLVNILESLNVRRYVSRLMPTSTNNVVGPQILNFQARYSAILNNRRHRSVRPVQHAEHERMLGEIWTAGRLGEEWGAGSTAGSVNGHGGTLAFKDAYAENRNAMGWERLGLKVDGDGSFDGHWSEGSIFRSEGELALDCLHWFATHEESFHGLVLEQEARPLDRRCPIGKASAECVKILCEHYKISQAGHHAPSQFQLFLLHFPRLHSMVLKFFLRMWAESESTLADFSRLVVLVRLQIRQTLADEVSKSWLHLERDLLEADYRTIRDRQMEQMEKEEGMQARPSVVELRENMSREAYNVVAAQRIGCMLQGAWFNASQIVVAGARSTRKANALKPLRFVRLSPDRRVLAWGEFTQRTAQSPALDSLPERIDLSSISELRLSTGVAVNSRAQHVPSKLSFSLMTGPETCALDLDAVHAAQLAEWTDGIRALRGEGGMAMKETADYVHILTELAVRVRLLDITGDGVDLPEKILYGRAPCSVDFWFAK